MSRAFNNISNPQTRNGGVSGKLQHCAPIVETVVRAAPEGFPRFGIVKQAGPSVASRI